MKKIISIIAIGLFVSSAVYAQQDTYVAPTGNMVTHPGAQVAIFGNLINDARGTAATASTSQTGVNHAGGGTVYLYRHAINGTGNSRIYDGPLATSATNNYNAGGSAVRFYNLVTDNNVGTALPSGTIINGTNGSGQIQIEQEACVSNLHTFTNGIVWTPRGAWKHAFLHYDADGAAYYGVGASNSAFGSPATNMQVDGYVAKTGSSNFVFPIGDGVYTRFSGLSSPANGVYKSAFFHQNAQTGTTGISGTSASTGPMNGGIKAVNTTEFWDIDGTASSKFSLDAFNSAGYSNWNNDLSDVIGAAPSKIVITAWDAWENLGIAPAPATYNDDGTFVTAIATNPDTGSPFGTNLPFSAYTWAIAPVSVVLPLEVSHFEATAHDCKAYLNWATGVESNIKGFEVMLSSDGVNFKKAGEVAPKGDNSTYGYDADQGNGKAYYYIRIIGADGRVSQSRIIVVNCNCNGNYSIRLFPNPVSEVLHVNGLSGGEQIRIIASNGQLMLDKKLSGTDADLNMQLFVPGVYSVSITNGNTVVLSTTVIKGH